MPSEPPSPNAFMQLGMGFMASKTLLTAIELGVCTELGQGPLTRAQLQSRLGLHERSAHDFLDALVALRVLDRDGDRYVNTPDAALFLDRTKPGYAGGILEMANQRLYGFWGRLTDALRNGQPQNELREGVDLFASIYADPAKLRSFLQAMSAISRPVAQEIACVFPWQNVRSFADLGCAQGGCTAAIAAAHPHLTGIGFDLPAVGPVFEDYIRQHGLADRLRFQPGSFFTDPLPVVDALIMGHVLHDWDLAEKRLLIARAHQALPKGGSLLVYEAMIDDDRRANVFGLLMSLNMLIETSGGFDYTAADCIGWMREAGFNEACAQPLSPTHSLVIGTK